VFTLIETKALNHLKFMSAQAENHHYVLADWLSAFILISIILAGFIIWLSIELKSKKKLIEIYENIYEEEYSDDLAHLLSLGSLEYQAKAKLLLLELKREEENDAVF